MIWDAIDFICRETLLHLRRERLIAIATVSTVAVLLIVLGAIVLFLLNLRLWTRRVAEDVQVFAYFRSGIPREEALEKSREIGRWPEVRSMQFVPREKGWEQMKERYEAAADLGEVGNPLPDRADVWVKDPSLVPEVAEKLEALEEVDKVISKAGFARAVVQAKRAVAWAGVVISLLAAVAGVFIVHNTIRLALHSRWREIYIMQLVGATPVFIAAPFLLEGVTHGALGAAIACCLLVPAHMYLHSLAANSFLPLLSDRTLLPFALYLLVAGAVLGFTGSAFSVRRYLRRKPEWQG